MGSWGGRDRGRLVRSGWVGTLVAGGLLLAGCNLLPPPLASGDGGAAPPTVPLRSAATTSPTYFSASSPFNQPAAATVGPMTPAEHSLVQQMAGGTVADIYQFGEPVFTDVTASTPTYHVPCTEPWGTCSLSQVQVPIPADATPAPGSDHEMDIVNQRAGVDYEFWQAQQADGGWKTSWGSVVSLNGIGNADIDGQGAPTGSGISRLEGVALISQLEAGNIPHALAFSSSLTCSTYVYPATSSDGHGTAPNCLPEGARIQLDPSVNLAAIPGITPFELAVGRALQTYGAFCKDTGGAPLALIFQEPAPGGPDPYPGLGVPGDYWNMPHIPWSALRIVSD